MNDSMKTFFLELEWRNYIRQRLEQEYLELDDKWDELEKNGKFTPRIQKELHQRMEKIRRIISDH